MLPISLLKEKKKQLRKVWEGYRGAPTFEHFVEFVLLLNNLTDALSSMALSGPLHECQRLEKESMSLFGEDVPHPLPPEWIEELSNRVERFCRLLQYYSAGRKKQDERREHPEPEEQLSLDGVQSVVCMLGERGPCWHELVLQLGYFGFTVREADWDALEVNDFDLGIYLVDLNGRPEAEWVERLKGLREARPMARILCLAAPDTFSAQNLALKAGADHCLTHDASLQFILERVLSQEGEAEQESYRVLVVEDSRTTALAIRNCLEGYGITVQLLYDPLQTLESIRQFTPDLILMDMYMPGCTGVEVARVVRLYDEFLGIPIVYLSSETNIGLQVEALRLGGDQFLTKPFNPVLMNAVIKSKIDRYRALRRFMENDSLTGLLNHISSKQALATALESHRNESPFLSIVMLDIDHFKRVNDEHGHPVGDQVIRSLAWLLRRRLRRSDIIGRYGGEEFVIGLFSTQVEDAEDVINRIREDFSKISFKGLGRREFRVTLSAGIAYCTDAQHNLTALLEAADGALYEAKHRGRNLVVIAGES